MSQARILDLADAAVTLIGRAWATADPPRAPPSAVQRVYAPPIPLTGDAQDPLAGRQVYVFPGPYDASQVTRDEQFRRFTLQVLTVERFTGDGDPPNTWVDDRVTFVEQGVFNLLANRELKLVGEATPDPDEPSTIDLLYDRPELIQQKTFWSVCTFHFIEGADNTGAHP